MVPSGMPPDGIANGVSHSITIQTNGIRRTNGDGDTDSSPKTIEPAAQELQPVVAMVPSEIHSKGIANGVSHSATIQINETRQTNGDGNTNGISKTNEVVAHEPQPIAIVGMSVRLPGNVTTTDEFWELCSRGRSGVRIYSMCFPSFFLCR
jgi:hypothetical protein